MWPSPLLAKAILSELLKEVLQKDHHLVGEGV
jgi:hypothetical protein